MNNRVLFAALIIAMLATTAAYASPAAATSNPESSPTPSRNMADLTIPSSLTYDVNGTLFAWINASGHAYITTNIPGFRSYNITVKQLYLAVRISAEASNIKVNNTGTGVGIVTGDIDINARVVVKMVIYANDTDPLTAFVDHSDSAHWPVRWVIPWGATKNFTIPFPSFSADPTSPSSSGADTIGIKFTDDNDTWASTQYSVNHVQWNFTNWLQNRIQNDLNTVWGKALGQLQNANIPGFQGGFNVVKCIGYVDLWKTSGTTPDNILLMAGGLIDLLVDFTMVGHGSTTATILTTTYTITYDVDFFAEFGLYFSIAVTSNWQIKTAESGGHYSLNEYLVQIPENDTLVWRKVGVIIYFGSPAHGIDVTGGVSWGNTTFGGETLFFVDYGWDGTPDFATNGTGQPDQLTDNTGTTTGTGASRNVTLAKLIAGDWVYFKLTIPAGYTLKAVWKIDGTTRTAVNVTQYWTKYGVLYVCDDPAYTYTVELTPPSGTGGTGVLGDLTMPILVGVVALVAVGALVVLTRRKSGSTVHIK